MFRYALKSNARGITYKKDKFYLTAFSYLFIMSYLKFIVVSLLLVQGIKFCNFLVQSFWHFNSSFGFAVLSAPGNPGQQPNESEDSPNNNDAVVTTPAVTTITSGKTMGKTFQKMINKLNIKYFYFPLDSFFQRRAHCKNSCFLGKDESRIERNFFTVQWCSMRNILKCIST